MQMQFELTNPGTPGICREVRQIKNKPLKQQAVRMHVSLEIMKEDSSQINITNSGQPEFYSSIAGNNIFFSRSDLVLLVHE
jgi:hypothetical protein